MLILDCFRVWCWQKLGGGQVTEKNGVWDNVDMERKECSIFLHTFDSFDISFVGGKRGCVVIVAAVAVIWNVDRRRGFWDRLVQNFCCKCNYRSLVDIILIFFFVNSCHIRSDTGENAQKKGNFGCVEIFWRLWRQGQGLVGCWQKNKVTERLVGGYGKSWMEIFSKKGGAGCLVTTKGGRKGGCVDT